METRSLPSVELESTGPPVAPPRMKKKPKPRVLKQFNIDKGLSSSAPCSPIPSAPRRPPAPRFTARPFGSTEAVPVKVLRQAHTRVVKTLSVPFRPAPPARVSTTDTPSVKRAPERPKTPNPKPVSPPQNIPPRSKSSLSTAPVSSLQHNSTHCRSASDTMSVYDTRSREKKTTTRCRSEDSHVRASGPHYLNVAPRAPGTSKASVDKVSLSKDYSQIPKISKQSPSSVAPSRVNASKSAQNLYQMSSPPKRPQNPPTQERNKQKFRPQRPAPPPPEKVAHYSVYTEIGPAESVSGDMDSDNYCYVSMEPRITVGMSRQVQGLDLQVSSQQNSQFDSEIYVNDDYNGLELKKAGSVDESIYMALTSTTMSDQDVYMAPQVDREKPQQHNISRANKQPINVEDESVEHVYLVPDDAHFPSNHQLTEQEHYMALSSSTIKEASIYHSLDHSLVNKQNSNDRNKSITLAASAITDH